MREIAHAKINLALHVRGREPDGYHRIETIFAFAEDGDRLHAEPSDTLTLEVEGPFADALGADNIVLRAAEALRVQFGISTGAALRLEKVLPVAAGLGGGSADAAATLRLLSRWWKPDVDADRLLAIASALGADVPACLRNETVRGEGRGDRLVSQDGSGLAGMPVLLVNPGVALPTASVFRAWDGVDRGPLPIASPLRTALEARNDLESPACILVPQIKELLALLQTTDALLVRMSGSGATCYALYEGEKERDQAGDFVRAVHPQWWQLRTCLK